MCKSNGNIKILNKLESESIRQKYIQTFVDTNKKYYIERIKEKQFFTDGFCYTGYLWDCFKRFELKSESDCETFLSKQKNLYIFWDIHSSENILIPNYWKYPKESVLFLPCWNRDMYYDTLPEDIYFFDDSFSWSIAYTHEDDLDGKRFCYFARV